MGPRERNDVAATRRPRPYALHGLGLPWRVRLAHVGCARSRRRELRSADAEPREGRSCRRDRSAGLGARWMEGVVVIAAQADAVRWLRATIAEMAAACPEVE